MYLEEYKVILLASAINKNETEKEKLERYFEKKTDWIRIAGLILNNRLGGYFYCGLDQQQRKYLPKEMKKALDLLVLGQTIKQREMFGELQILMRELEESNIRYSGLKGVIFGTEMYRTGLRRSNDIDLLVYEEDLKKLDDIMRKLGYIQTNYPDILIEASKREKVIQRMNYHDLVPYVKKIGKSIIEVDINFLFDGKDNLVDEKVFSMGTRIYKGKEYSFRGLIPSTFLSFLFVHFYREATEKNWVESKRNITLYKIADIINYIRYYRKDLDPYELIIVFRMLNIVEKVYCGICILEELYEDEFTLLLKTAIEEQCGEINIKKNNNIKNNFFIDLLEY